MKKMKKNRIIKIFKINSIIIKIKIFKINSKIIQIKLKIVKLYQRS